MKNEEFATELARLVKLHGEDDRAVLLLKYNECRRLLREYYDGDDFGAATGASLDAFFNATIADELP